LVVTVHGDDLLFDARQVLLILLDDWWFMLSVPVPRHSDFGFAKLTYNRFLAVPVPAILGLLVRRLVFAVPQVVSISASIIFLFYGNSTYKKQL